VERHWQGSASRLESLIGEYVMKVDMNHDGIPWLDDIVAERWVLRRLWEGETAPAWFGAADFYYPYYRYLYALSVRWKGRTTLDVAHIIGIELLEHYGLDTVLEWEKAESFDAIPLQLLGPWKLGDIEEIGRLGQNHRPSLTMHCAAQRVRELALRRHAHYTVMRLKTMLEMATLDDKELRRAFYTLRDEFTELFQVRRDHGGGGSEAPSVPPDGAVRPLRQSGPVRCAPRDLQPGDGPESARPGSVPPLPPASHGLPQRKRSLP
jgi:hypothetical protein